MRQTTTATRNRTTPLSREPLLMPRAAADHAEASPLGGRFHGDFSRMRVSAPEEHAEQEAALTAALMTGAWRVQQSAALMSVPHDVADGIRALAGHGRPMTPSERSEHEPRFAIDFGKVRLHDDVTAGRLAQTMQARAFTVGTDIVFASGEYTPQTGQGRHLLAHELTHVVQQGRAGRQELQRDPAGGAAPTADPLCGGHSFAEKKKRIAGFVTWLTAVNADVEARLRLVQEIKWVLRCGTKEEQAEIRSSVATGLGAKAAASIMKEAASPFGGYSGAFPGYYPGAKSNLKSLGVAETKEVGAFPYEPGKTSEKKYDPAAEKAATAAAPDIAATDILYFYGHQYARYDVPGAFANGTQTSFVDLSRLKGKGDFSRVKLMISTSCATLCKEALDVFTSLFPNAVVLGYRNTAPIEGDAVREAFDAKIHALKKPLLLDQPVDVAAIIGAWKSVVQRAHGKEHESMPGFYQGGTVNYLEDGTWKTIAALDKSNTCVEKGSGIEQAAH